MSAPHLLDTNILLRLSNPADVLHETCAKQIEQLHRAGATLYVTAQVLIEFWAVATRPTNVNGLGWNAENVSLELDDILVRFGLLPDHPAIFEHWRGYVSSHRIHGKKVHDVRLIATMKA
jgi:predicted nucleic acid-binding protein